jgi:hypothetical protein
MPGFLMRRSMTLHVMAALVAAIHVFLVAACKAVREGAPDHSGQRPFELRKHCPDLSRALAHRFE